MAVDYKAKTSYPLFNNAWNHLIRLHAAHILDGVVVLVLSVQPRLKTYEDYLDWLDSLFRILLIGGKNGWVELDLDRDGKPAGIRINQKILEGGQ